MTLPAMLTRDIKNLQIQSSQTKIPLPRMAIRALEIRAPTFSFKRDVPAPAPLVCNQGQAQTVVLSNVLDELCITLDGPEPVGDGQS